MHHFGSGFSSKHSHLCCTTPCFLIWDTQDIIFPVAPSQPKLFCISSIFHMLVFVYHLKTCCVDCLMERQTCPFLGVIVTLPLPNVTIFFPFFIASVSNSCLQISLTILTLLRSEDTQPNYWLQYLIWDCHHPDQLAVRFSTVVFSYLHCSQHRKTYCICLSSKLPTSITPIIFSTATK